MTLYGNPICAKPAPEADEEDLSYSYRYEVIKILPDLQILDDELTLNTRPFSPRRAMTRSGASKDFLGKGDLNSTQFYNDLQQQCPFDDDWQLINQILDEGIGLPEENLAINESIRPGTSSSYGDRGNPSVRPLSAMRPLSSFRIRTSHRDRPRTRDIRTSNSSSGLNTATSRVSTSSTRPNTDPISDIGNDASHLTVGPTLQGNPLKQLIARRRSNNRIPSESNYGKNGSEINGVMVTGKPSTYKAVMETLEKSKNTSDIKLENTALRDEILKWRKEHAK